MNPQGQGRDFHETRPHMGSHDPSPWATHGAGDPESTAHGAGYDSDSQHTRVDRNQGPAMDVQRPSVSEGDNSSLSNSRELPVREKPKTNGSGNIAKPPPGQRTCWKCGQQLSGQFVRAIGGTFHLECFKCQVTFHTGSMSIVVALTFFHPGLWTSRRIQVLPGRQ